MGVHNFLLTNISCTKQWSAISRPWEAANARPFDEIIDNAVASLMTALDNLFDDDDDSDDGSYSYSYDYYYYGADDYYYYGADDDSVGGDNDLIQFDICKIFTGGNSSVLCTLVSETLQNSKRLVSLFTRDMDLCRENQLVKQNYANLRTLFCSEDMCNAEPSCSDVNASTASINWPDPGCLSEAA